MSAGFTASAINNSTIIADQSMMIPQGQPATGYISYQQPQAIGVNPSYIDPGAVSYADPFIQQPAIQQQNVFGNQPIEFGYQNPLQQEQQQPVIYGAPVY